MQNYGQNYGLISFTIYDSKSIIFDYNRDMKPEFKILSLFSSAGIAEFGFDNPRFQVVLANEIIKKRSEVYSFWHPDSEMILGDITNGQVKKDIIKKSKEKEVNFVLATPPCQGMSLIGKNKTNSQMLEDSRNYLIFHVFDIVDELDPDIVMIENVGRFLKVKYPYNNSVMTVDQILEDLYGSKYCIDCKIYDAADYGVPQHRERAIIRLWKKDYSWGKPEKQNQITVRDAIGDLPTLESGETSDIKNHFARKHTKENVLCMKHTPSGKSATQNTKYYPINNRTGKKVKCYSASYKRIDWDKPAPTITMRNDCIASQSNVHPGRKLKDGTYSDARVLTIRELFLLSSINPDLELPEFASDIQIRHIIGEAVPPRLIREVVTCLEEK